MAAVQIEYVNRSGPAHQHITDLGSSALRYTRQQVIDRLERKSGQYAFFVMDAVRNVALIEVIDDPVHGKYVRPRAGGRLTDDLLSLPRCPSALKPATG